MKNLLYYVLAGCFLIGLGGLLGHYLYRTAPQDVAIVVLPSGEELAIKSEDIQPSSSETAKSTEYTGEGVSYSRKVEHARVFSPFGVSPGESLSRQEPAKISTGAAPSINITPEGVQAEDGGGTKFQGGGGSWGIFSTIWQRLKDWGWIIGIGAVVLLILPIVFPAAAPIVSAIWGAVKKVVLWLIPFFGGLWTWLTGRKQTQTVTTALQQTGQALDSAKKTLRESQSSMTGAQAWQIVSDQLGQCQDASVKQMISDMGLNQ